MTKVFIHIEIIFLGTIEWYQNKKNRYLKPRSIFFFLFKPGINLYIARQAPNKISRNFNNVNTTLSKQI